MNDIISFFALRTFLIFFSTAFSILTVMLLLNIITVDEVITMLNMSPEAANVLKQVLTRIQEVTGNILDIISQLLSKLLSWAGVESDLRNINVDVHANPHPVQNPSPNK